MLQRMVLPKKLKVAHLLIQFPVFYWTRGFITISTNTLPTNSFSPPTFCSHIYPSLHNIAITAHMFSALQVHADTTKWGTKKVRHWQTTEPLN